VAGDCAGSPAKPPGTSGDQLSTRGGEVSTPVLPGASGRQKPGDLRSFHPRAAQLLLRPGTWEGSGHRVAQDCSVAAPGIRLCSRSALVALVSSVASSSRLSVFLPSFPSFEHLQLVCLYFSHACRCLAIRELKALSAPWWEIGESAPRRTVWWFKKVKTFLAWRCL